MAGVLEPRLTDGRLKIRHLALADALTAQGSLVSAATALHVSQPALTRTLRELETIMGIELFDRGPRGVVPTVYGEMFTDYARRVLATLNQAGRHIVELANAHRGVVTVGVDVFGGHDVVGLAVARMKTAHPQVTVTVVEATTDDLVDGVETGEFDFALGPFGSVRERKELSRQPAYLEQICLAVRRDHPWQRRQVNSLAELTNSSWVLPAPSSPLRAQVDLLLDEAGVATPDDRVEAASAHSLLAIVAHGDAVGIALRSTVDADSRVRRLGARLDLATLPFAVLTPSDRPAGPVSRALLGEVTDAAGRRVSVT